MVQLTAMGTSVERVFAIAISSFLTFAVSGRADRCELQGKALSGSSGQGAYHLSYSSQAGNGCRVYEIRSEPGSPLTPFTWKESREVFLSTTLPECAKTSRCTPLHIEKPSFRSDSGATTLSYGLNRDEFREQFEGYVEKYSQTSTALIQTHATPVLRIQGTIASSNGKPILIDVELTTGERGAGKRSYEYAVNVTPHFENSSFGVPQKFSLITRTTAGETFTTQLGWGSFRAPFDSADPPVLLQILEGRKVLLETGFSTGQFSK